MSQLDFRIKVIESLVTIPDHKLPKGKAIDNAQKAASRADRIDHLIEHMERRSRCGQCGIKTEYGCMKCDVTLHQHCFWNFHNNVPKDIAKIKKAK